MVVPLKRSNRSMFHSHVHHSCFGQSSINTLLTNMLKNGVVRAGGGGGGGGGRTCSEVAVWTLPSEGHQCTRMSATRIPNQQDRIR